MPPIWLHFRKISASSLHSTVAFATASSPVPSKWWRWLEDPILKRPKQWYLTCVSVFMCIHIYIYLSLHVYVYMYGSSVPYFACVIYIPMHAHFMNIQKAPSKSQTFIPNSSHLDLLRSSFLPMLWHVIKWQVQWFSERLKSYPLVLFHIAREFHFPFVDHF